MKKQHQLQPSAFARRAPWLFLIALLAVLGVAAYVFWPSASANTGAGAGPFQEVRMGMTSTAYVPNAFTVKAGEPVRWTVNPDGARGCIRSLVMPAFGIRAILHDGDNVFEFTPTKAGTYPFSCSMGMYRGAFIVQ